MSERNGLEIAIIGMAGRFPRANDVEQFWQNLREGQEGISFFTDEELAGIVPPAMLANPNFVKACAVLEGAELFDAAFFDYSPREAEILDPQQRFLLECGWEALENAGYAGTSRPVGVFVGVTQNTYFLYNVLANLDSLAAIGAFGLSLANEKDFSATRMAYKLNLEGPSVAVQTACSTSLVATHLACQSLLAGECELALAGGSTVRAQQKGGHLYQEGGIVSPDGHTRAFDAKARGTAGGQGTGVIVLKLLEDALADGDTIHAVIKGSAINNDGSQKPGFTAPRRDGQARVIRAAQARAEVAPESIGYIETHGTATPLGDPIEVAALTRAFRMGTQRRGFCAIGSLKSNIGHLDAAAGIASLIKTALVVERGEIPPSLHFESPNPEIDFDSSPFFVNTRLRPWPEDQRPRRAGVSSFGIGGTNAHIVLEEPPAAVPSGPSRPWQLLLLSARTASALETATDDLAAWLESNPETPLADVAFTLRVGRKSFEHRRALMAADAAGAAEALRERDPRRVWTFQHEAGDRPLAFLLPGVGEQYAGMAAGLYHDEPVFRAEMDRCAEHLLPLLGADLREVLFGSNAEVSAPAGGIDLRAMLRRHPSAEAASPLARTEIAQPAMFAVAYALARLWVSWGVRPQALLGYSLGEYTAACLAGVMSLEGALTLVARRAQLIAGLPAGAMLAVPLPEAELARRLPEGLSIAAVNAPAVCVVSGPVEEVTELETRLSTEGLACRRLQTTHAFHSRMMEPIREAFRAVLDSVELRAPQLPYLSNVTGTWATAAEATDPEHWIAHLLGTVRFSEAVGELWREPGRILLELGPGPSLGSLALQHQAASGASGAAVFASLRHEYDRQDDPAHLLKTLGQLWLAGIGSDPAGFFKEERRRRVPLPTYPFERQRYWLDRPAAPEPGAEHKPAGATRPADKIADREGWFHAPSWRLAPRPLSTPPNAADDGGLWLLLLDEQGIGDRLADALEARGARVVTAVPGPGFASLGERSFCLAPASSADCEALLAELGAAPERILHLWTLTVEARTSYETAQKLGFHSLLALAQALGRLGLSTRTDIAVVTNGLCSVERNDPVDPAKATLIGPVRVISQEYPSLSCRAIDVDAREPGDRLDAALLAELSGEPRPAESIVALRGDRRWLPAAEALPLPAAPAPLRQDGVYLITGGLGGLGLGLADHLARPGARLALLGRTGLPEGTERERVLAAEPEGRAARRIRAVQALEQAGAEVLVLTADVADEAAVRAAVADVLERFGHLDGVFHTAGVPGAGLLQLKTREQAEEVLAPKTRGTLALAAALEGVPVDFVVLYSALTALAGGVGQVDYCAANAFLDAFAQACRARGTLPAVSVNWCEWQWDDWAGRLSGSDPRIQGEMQRQRDLFGLSFEEGFDALSRILASGLPQAIVSTRPLQIVLEQQHSVAQLLETLKQARPASAGHDRPALGTPYVAPSDDVEERLAGIWRELLGVRQIGVHDNFFQLGGHSLLGLQMMSRIQSAFGVEVPLRALFESPTVSELAAALSAGKGSAAVMPEIRRAETFDAREVLDNLDALSEEEMDRLLSEMMAEEGDA